MVFCTVFCILWLALLPLGAQTRTWVPVWLGDGSRLSEAQLQEALQQMKKQEAQPQQIVVLVHGYHTIREDSAQQFDEVAPRILSSFQARKQRALVVGLQWESAIAGAGVPWEAEEAYLSMVGRARNVGHQAVRQLLLRVQKQYPHAAINLMGHSLGCEVSAACLLPEMAYSDDLEKSQAFEPKQDLFFNMVALCGSDLDYDVWYKSHVTFRSKKARTHLLWMTVSPYLGERDKTLQVRQVSRGTAGGAAFPRMTEQQYDVVFQNRKVVFDNRDIPTDHALTGYFSAERIERLAAAAVSLVDPKAPRPLEFEEADKILKLPNKVEVLAPWLDSPVLNSQIYALWRLEHLNCGGSQHMADETLDQVARLMRNKPTMVRRQRAESVCKTVQRGLWPTETQLTRAGAPAWED